MAVTKLPYRYDRVEEEDEIVVSKSKGRSLRWILYTALTSSCLVNIAFIVKWFFYSNEAHQPNTSRSPYASLLNNVPVPFTWSSEYSDLNSPRLDDLWQFDGTLDYGMIALTEAEVESMSLLPSEQSFPWDPQNKKMYVLNAHHGLHCLRLIYTSISAYRASTPQIVPHAHVMHCLDNLRQDIICTADDSPRYFTNNGTHSGENQVRFCRDFDQLNIWAAEHDACFHQNYDLGETVAPIEKFKYCKTSEYLEQVREYFHLPSDWEPPTTPGNQS